MFEGDTVGSFGGDGKGAADTFPDSGRLHSLLLYCC